MIRLHKLSRTLASVALLLNLAAMSRAQESVPEKLTKTDTTLVRLNLMVTDEKGRTVSDLKTEELRLQVDGIEQPITYFAKETLPVSYGLVVDNSGSLKAQIEYVIASAKLVVDSNAPEDKTFIVRFISSDNIKIMQGFTADKSILFSSLSDMFIEGGQTALLDAVYLSGDYLLKKSRGEEGKKRRRALLVISDGDDRASFYNFDQVSKLLKRTDVQIFCIGLTATLDKERGFTMPSKHDKASDLLKRLANETGGRIFFAEKVGELNEAIGEIISNLHTQYVVGYDPPATAGGKTKYKIEIKIVDAPGRGKLKAVVRPERTDAGGVNVGEQKKR